MIKKCKTIHFFILFSISEKHAVSSKMAIDFNLHKAYFNGKDSYHPGILRCRCSLHFRGEMDKNSLFIKEEIQAKYFKKRVPLFYHIRCYTYVFMEIKE